jgi:bifunctional non-homologous end joining protein LigD
MAATLTQDRFNGPEWIFERKFDGIRLLAFKDGESVRLLSRNRLPQQLPAITGAVAQLPRQQLVLDGELTWRNGSADYHVFDVMWIDGEDLTSRPLEQRQAVLRGLPLLRPLRHVEPLDEPCPWERACREGWEGVIAKRRGSLYEPRRSRHWLKMKCEAAQPFVVGGITDPKGSRAGLGALLVGYYAGDDLVFAGKIGTGFDTALLVDTRQRLDRLSLPHPPFTRGTGFPRLGVHWVQPEIVAQVAFIEWTVHGKLRHPRFLGFRSDIQPRDVVRGTS